MKANVEGTAAIHTFSYAYMLPKLPAGEVSLLSTAVPLCVASLQFWFKSYIMHNVDSRTDILRCVRKTSE